MTGRANARVLPLPVLARPIKSRPSIAGAKTDCNQEAWLIAIVITGMVDAIGIELAAEEVNIHD
jgi:hypothetical protein